MLFYDVVCKPRFIMQRHPDRVNSEGYYEDCGVSISVQISMVMLPHVLLTRHRPQTFILSIRQKEMRGNNAAVFAFTMLSLLSQSPSGALYTCSRAL
jgi:hypothetical protein